MKLCMGVRIMRRLGRSSKEEGLKSSEVLHKIKSDKIIHNIYISRKHDVERERWCRNGGCHKVPKKGD